MEEKEPALETLFKKVEAYSDTSLQILKLKAIDRSATLISNLASKAILTVVALLIAFLVNIGAALWLGEILGRYYYGFFALALFYSIIAVIVHIFKEQLIEKPIGNSIIIRLTKEKAT
jgi:uncharacterized membrane protein